MKKHKHSYTQRFKVLRSNTHNIAVRYCWCGAHEQITGKDIDDFEVNYTTGPVHSVMQARIGNIH